MRYKKIAIKLWNLLDDIDTAGNLYKPEMNEYFKSVCRKVSKRSVLMGSDGCKVKRNRYLTKIGRKANER